MSDKAVEQLEPGNKVRWRDRTQMAALAMGQHEIMVVVEAHPKLRRMWKVRGPDGYEDWVRDEWVWKVRS